MPAFRNIVNRHSGRLSKSTPVVYDEQGWEVHDAIVSVASSFPCLDIKPDHLKVEQNDQALPPLSPSAASSSSTGSSPFSESSFTVEPRAISTSASPAPSRKDTTSSHSRRRDPSHIPRPRNAFILFRSDYIKRELAQGLAEGQQNELSKHAGKVWNKMSAQDKRPYAERAALEKEEHYKKYPNYVYAPGRNGHSNAKAKPPKRRPGAATGRGQAKRRKASVLSDEDDSSSSSTPMSPDMSPIMPPMRPQKNRRIAAQRATLKFTEPASPSPSLSPSPSISDSHNPGDKVKAESTSFSAASLSFVPMSEIPPFELTPRGQEFAETRDLWFLPQYSTNPYSYFMDDIPEEYMLERSGPMRTLPPDTIIVDDAFAEFLNPREQNTSGTCENLFADLSDTTCAVSSASLHNNASAIPTSTTTTPTTTATTPSLAPAFSAPVDFAFAYPDISPIFRWNLDSSELLPDFSYPFLLEPESDPYPAVHQFFDQQGNHLY